MLERKSHRNPHVKWTPEMDKEMLNLLKSNPISVTARKMGISRNAVVRRFYKICPEGKGFRHHDATRGHPFVRVLFEQMNIRGMTATEMATSSGISHTTLNNWRKYNPHVQNLEACFNVIGMTLTPHPIEQKTSK